jgi:hypothetical protein
LQKNLRVLSEEQASVRAEIARKNRNEVSEELRQKEAELRVRRRKLATDLNELRATILAERGQQAA